MVEALNDLVDTAQNDAEPNAAPTFAMLRQSLENVRPLEMAKAEFSTALTAEEDELTESD